MHIVKRSKEQYAARVVNILNNGFASRLPLAQQNVRLPNNYSSKPRSSNLAFSLSLVCAGRWEFFPSSTLDGDGVGCEKDAGV